MIFCVLCFVLCMFLLYVTVLLPVGIIKDDDDSDHRRETNSFLHTHYPCSLAADLTSSPAVSLILPTL